MNARKETKGSCGRKGLKLEISLEWGATSIYIMAYITFYYTSIR